MWPTHLILTLFKTTSYLILPFAVLLIGLRFWIQPVKAVCRCKTKLSGKVALVTGGNSGIGLETARDLARRGARVIIASRDVSKSTEAVRDIINTTGNSNVEHRQLDLANFKNIRKFAEEFNKTEDRLDILVNNAGVSGLNYRLTEDGLDMLMQINYFGPALLTNLLLNKLQQSKPSRIVTVTSSLQHDGKIDLHNLESKDLSSYYQRYANSKLCNVIWTKALAQRVDSVSVNCVHPGLVYTDIYNSFGVIQKIAILSVIRLLFKTAVEGAQTCIHLCVAPELENKSGNYYVECKERRPARVARDEDFVNKVWNRTMEVIKQ
ncbi:unnamed protein product [Pieris brassicae]|uniref:Uncharacterized protein n=1 Tax=Pieris brassicae TaxID=7116 RepID=A0A9P0TC00_PIEBR|nr:unnamed protein product [Pieris brassicae]